MHKECVPCTLFPLPHLRTRLGISLYCKHQKPRWWPENEACNFVRMHLWKHLTTELNLKKHVQKMLVFKWVKIIYVGTWLKRRRVFAWRDRIFRSLWYLFLILETSYPALSHVVYMYMYWCLGITDSLFQWLSNSFFFKKRTFRTLWTQLV